MKRLGKVLLALLATVGAAAILGSVATWLVNAQQRQYWSGAQLADILIDAARLNNGAANVTGVCVLPGTGSVDFDARNLFPGAEIQFIESNESDVAWYIVIRNKTGRLEIYEIRHSRLWWDIDETKGMNDLITCPRKIFIEYEERRCQGCTGYVVLGFESWRGGASGP